MKIRLQEMDKAPQRNTATTYSLLIYSTKGVYVIIHSVCKTC